MPNNPHIPAEAWNNLQYLNGGPYGTDVEDQGDIDTTFLVMGGGWPDNPAMKFRMSSIRLDDGKISVDAIKKLKALPLGS